MFVGLSGKQACVDILNDIVDAMTPTRGCQYSLLKKENA